MTDRKPPPLPKRAQTVPPPLPQSAPPAPPPFEAFRPVTERADRPAARREPPSLGSTRPAIVRPQAAKPRRAASASRRREDEFDDGRSWLVTFLLWGGLGLAGLAAAAMVALTVWSPAGLVRDQLAARIKARTGRDLVVAGPTTLTFFPSLAISMSEVSLSAPPAMGGAPTIKMQALEASVPLVPLLQRQITVERLVLRRPVIDLRVDATGRRSWDFAGLLPQPPVRLAQAGGTRPGQMPKELQDFVKSSSPDSVEAATSRGGVAALDALALHDVRIEGGSLRYADARSGVTEDVQTIDAQVALAGLGGTLDAKGSLVWRSEPIAFDAKLTSPKLLSEERPARLVLKVAGRPLDLAYDGAVTGGRTPEAEGTLALKSPALKSLLALARLQVTEAGGFETARVEGRIKASEASIALSEGTIALDGLVARGSVSVENHAPRPMLRGNLQIAELDLNRLSLPAVAAVPVAPAAPPPSPKPVAAPAAAKPAQSIEDLLKADAGKPGPRVQGYTRRTGWSDDVIDLAALRLADADVKLSIGRLLFREIKAGQTQLRVVLKDRAIQANFDDVHLYDGRGRGFVTFDGSAAVPIMGANFSLDGTSALPFLKDAAAFDWVAGKAKVNVALGGQGASERQIVSTLNGKADVQFKDGAVIGYDVARMLAGVGQGRLASLERSPTAKTDFSEMAASFTIQNGIATNKDLRLISPFVRLTGAGSANLAERTLDYVVRPKVVVAGAGESGGLEVPVKLTGSWDKPAIAPDLDAVLKNPEKAVDTLKALGQQFKDGNPQAVDKAKNLLQQFLKR